MEFGCTTFYYYLFNFFFFFFFWSGRHQQHYETPAQCCYLLQNNTDALGWGWCPYLFPGRSPFPTEASLVDFINLPFRSIFITLPLRASWAPSIASTFQATNPPVSHPPNHPSRARPYHSVPADDDPSPVTVPVLFFSKHPDGKRCGGHGWRFSVF